RPLDGVHLSLARGSARKWEAGPVPPPGLLPGADDRSPGPAALALRSDAGHRRRLGPAGGPGRRREAGGAERPAGWRDPLFRARRRWRTLSPLPAGGRADGSKPRRTPPVGAGPEGRGEPAY